MGIIRRARRRGPRAGSSTAIVHFAGGVRFVATAASPDALSVLLALYVRERCDDVLWPDAARRVRALLDDGKPTDAITLYFERTGERWDRERLDLVTVENGEYWIPAGAANLEHTTQETLKQPDAERLTDARR